MDKLIGWQVSYIFRACEEKREAELATVEALAWEGNASAIYHDYRSRTVAKLNASREWLDTFSWNGSKVHAEFLAALMDFHVWEWDVLKTADTYFQNFTESGSRHSLHGAFLNLLGRFHEADLMYLFDPLVHPPGPHCQAPGWSFRSAYADQVKAKVEALGRDTKWISQLPGRLMKVDYPAAKFYEEHGWWPGILGVDTELEWGLLAFDYQEGKRPPAPAYRPSLWNDWVTDNVRGKAEQWRAEGYPSPDDEGLAQTYSRVTWRFGQLPDCR